MCVCLCVCVVCVCVCVCVCLCLCVSYFRSHRSYLSENVKMTFVDFAICHRMSSLRKLYSVTVAYILDFKCLKYMFICFSYVTGQLKLWKTFSNTHSYICDRTLSYIIVFKCLICDMWNSFVFVCCRKKNHQYTQTFVIKRC